MQRFAKVRFGCFLSCGGHVHPAVGLLCQKFGVRSGCGVHVFGVCFLYVVEVESRDCFCRFSFSRFVLVEYVGHGEFFS